MYCAKASQTSYVQDNVLKHCGWGTWNVNKWMKKLPINVNMRGRTLVNNYKQKPFEAKKKKMKKKEFSESSKYI